MGSFILLKRDLSQETFTYPYVRAHYNGTKSDEECKLIAYELSAMMHLIVIRKDDIRDHLGTDVNNDDELKNLVDMRVDLLLKD